MTEPLPQCVRDGVIRSDRPGDVTTVWRDGQVFRTDRFNRTFVQEPIRALADSTPEPSTEESIEL